MPEIEASAFSEGRFVEAANPRLIETYNHPLGAPITHTDAASSVTLDRLYEIGNHIARNDTLDETLSTALDFINAIANCDSYFTFVLRGETFEPWVWKSSEHFDQSELELDQSIISFLAKSRVPAAISYDKSEKVHFRLFAHWSRNPGETFISVPLVSCAKLVGVMNFHHAPRAYNEHELKFLSTLGCIIGADIAISGLEAQN
ncbi:MAG TPA: GAF domain-containing protein, partial [Terriglobales bacterium]|nr:GAF domain-containing protein [Terriglobales bacterium]